ncbi:hypothetical protein CALVIDRAFT_308567 [Calocera viscosa TUFC12733]|uniref:Uncharacterized protein n=1 Tax=Calocera viscosa (strain TUFC12733) TaxID=1330018 RepID=A0A167I6G0_CALVF|nr:hypothetical protein CALVIDRAFT_308567 [Calocera viscosa TUFC12733]
MRPLSGPSAADRNVVLCAPTPDYAFLMRSIHTATSRMFTNIRPNNQLVRVSLVCQRKRSHDLSEDGKIRLGGSSHEIGHQGRPADEQIGLWVSGPDRNSGFCSFLGDQDSLMAVRKLEYLEGTRDLKRQQ